MPLEIYLILGAISFFTSMITAIFSVGGGMMMLASLGQFVSASALIPLHASVQLLNNISRVYVYKEHINFGILKTILWASLIGSLIAVFIFQNLNEYVLTLIIGFSILFLTWVPINKFIKHGYANDLICGLLAGIAGIFIGANGPIVTAFMRLKNLSPESLVANHGLVMVFQHSIKIILFISVIGFSLFNYSVLIIFLGLMGYLGTKVGKKLINKIDFKLFQTVLKILLSFLAILLILRAA